MLAILVLAIVGQMVHGADLDVLTDGTTSFAQRMYKEVALSKDNVVFSPFSIHSCLSMCSVGARGDTATEMASTLGLTSLADPHQTYHDLITQMNSVTDVKLNTANGVFINPAMPIESSFVSEVQADYYAMSSNFDLASPDGPEKPINDFVDQNTHGMIKDILPPGSIDGSTVMVLVNTIFFNGTWADKFSEYKTQQQDFYLPGGATTQVDMMHDDRTVNIKRGVHGADVAELPFKDPRFSLFIALPQQVDGISDLESQLAVPGNVDDLFEGLQPTAVGFAMPKFKIESSFGLNAPLQNMGINKAFDPYEADFSGMTSVDNVYISQVLHKAMIEVKETGTVAAAATSIQMVALSIMIPFDHFIVDHPFLFFLRDNTAGNILFQGKFSG